MSFLLYKTRNIYVGSELLLAVTLQSTTFWDVTGVWVTFYQITRRHAPDDNITYQIISFSLTAGA
jgi:hypothetical protein